ncbi:MAG TPA: transposase DNA-binding-containing protein, partial [Rhizomicrobium sp.]
MVEVLSPRAWALREFGTAELGDKRRTRRAVEYAAAAAAAPSQSIPDQCRGAWKKTKGAYRLFDRPQVSFEKLQDPHRRQTRQAAAEASVVLWVSDTTTLSFNHPATAGLGPTSSKGCGQGMLLHTTMAVDVSAGVQGPPMVLGLGHQQCWVRSEKKKNKKKKNKKNKEKKAAPPESVKWSAGIEAIGTPPSSVRFVHVGDCESDCWEAIDSCRSQGSGFALRACQNRQVIAGHLGAEKQAGSPPKVELLFDLMERQPMLGGKHLWVRGRGEQEPR